MKKSLLLTLVSLLVFNAVAWGECTKIYDTVRVYGYYKSISVNGRYSGNIAITPSSSKITISVYNNGSFKKKVKVQKSTDGGSSFSDFSDPSSSWEVKAGKTASSGTLSIDNTVTHVRFFNPQTDSDNYMDFTMTATLLSSFSVSGDNSYNFGDVSVNSSSTKANVISLNYSGNDGAISVSSDNPVFVPSVTSIAGCSTGSTDIDITATPTATGTTNGTITVKLGSETKKTINVSVNGTLPAPTTFEQVGEEYNSIKVRWSDEVSGASHYKITCEGQTIEKAKSEFTKEGNFYVYTWTGLNMERTYNCSVYSKSGSNYSSPNTKDFTTKDLGHTTLTVTPSYTSATVVWTPVADATKYILKSTTGLSKEFPSGTALAFRETGLTNDVLYTYTVETYRGSEKSVNVVSKSVYTKKSSCETENLTNVEFSALKTAGEYIERSITKNQPIIHFSFSTSSVAVGVKFKLEEEVNGVYKQVWDSESKSGYEEISLSRDTRKVRFYHAGSLGGNITNISVSQGSYFEVADEVDFQNVQAGVSPTTTTNVNYSLIGGDVYSLNNEFTVTPSSVGSIEDCAYGKDIPLTIKFLNNNVPGLHTGTIMVGNKQVTVKANVTLQVPTLTASDITYNSAKLSWNAVDGAEKYKLNFIGGNSIETTDTWSVCDNLKLHSSNQFTVQAYGGGQYTDPSNVVTVNTLDLAAPQNFTTEEVSYTSIPTVWDAVKDATGYRIQNETLYTYEDVNAETTAYLFAALNANTEYTISVTPIYNGELSNNKASLTVTTKETPYIPVSDCEQFRDVSEKSMEAFLIGKSTNYNFGKAIYKSNVSFKAKASNGALLNTDLYAQVNGQWQKIWDESDAEITSSYKTFTATVPDGATAIRFYNNTGSSMWRNYSEVIVKRRNELTPSTTLLQFGDILLGSTDTKTITVDYSNLSDMTVLSEGSNVFKVEIPETKACDYGTIECKVSYSPVTLDKTQQGTLTIFNGITKGIAIEGGVTPLPAANATAAATGKSAISVQWDKVAGATGYKLTCADAGINVTLPDDGSEHYSYNATGLNECTQYTFTITTMYNAIENSSTNVSVTTYSTINVIAAGEATATTSWTLTGIEGKWNKTENSFEVGSNVTIEANNSNTCAKFDKLMVGETAYTSNPQVFAVNAPVTATIYYSGKELEAPELTATCGSKSIVELSWNEVECADNYTIYINGEEVATGITATSYTATELAPATDYSFEVKAVSGTLESVSETVYVTTYGIIKVQAAGDATSTTDWTLTGEAGKWNETEESFEVGSQVSILASNSDAGVIFDKIQYYGGESTVNPTSITVLNASVAETWAGIYYKYNGVAKTDDGEVFQTLNDAVEYSKTHAVSEITLLADRTSENLDVTSGSNITINGQGFKIGDVTVESDAKLTTSGTLIVGDLNIKTEYRNSGEVDPKDDNLQVTGKASFDKILDPSGKVNSSMWYAVCVPFEVDIKDICGVYDDGTEKPFTYGYNYIIDEYDGAKRAASGKGWLDMDGSGTLLPGKMYIIIADINTIRFYKKSSAPIVSPLTHITLNEFAASDVRNQGWNALGNSQIFHVDIASGTEYAQVLKNGSTVYETVRLADESFAVAAPLFIQYNGGSTDVTLSKKTNGSLRSTYAENNTFNLRIASTEMSYDDQLFLTASETASADYIIGKDLIKMGDVTGVDVARIWLNAKDAKLSVMDALLFDGATEIPLGISAPKAGNYTLRLNESADRKTLELVKNGEIIHNFADGEFEMALTKGSNSGYSLRVAVDKDAPLPTDTEETNGITAYINDGVLYINGLNEGAEFSVIAESKVIAKGKANGGIEKITVPTQGLCVVISNGTTIKLMNIK